MMNITVFRLMMYFCLNVLYLVPERALAASDGDFVLSNVLSNLVDLLKSGIARTLFVLAIIGVGYGWLYLGRIPKQKAMGAIMGIGIVFSASYIANKLGIGN